MAKTRWSESAGWILGGAIIASALYQFHKRPNYDPSGLIAAGVTVITLTWAAPTKAVDDRISQIITGDTPNNDEPDIPDRGDGS